MFGKVYSFLVVPGFDNLYLGVNNLKFVNYESAVCRAADKSSLGL